MANGGTGVLGAKRLAFDDIPVIDIDGDTATGKWRILMPCTMLENGAHVSRWILGDYVEDYVRRDGEWLFAKIDFLVNFDVPSLESWAGKETVRI